MHKAEQRKPIYAKLYHLEYHQNAATGVGVDPPNRGTPEGHLVCRHNGGQMGEVGCDTELMKGHSGQPHAPHREPQSAIKPSFSLNILNKLTGAS